MEPEEGRLGRETQFPSQVMQYPVPQFTDVEDRIIGSLTAIQFGILFGVGVILFLIYTATKNVAITVLAVLFFGIPALGLAFIPYNGRPMYRMISRLIAFILSDKFLVFHREVYGMSSDTRLKNVEVTEAEGPEVVSAETTSNRLQAVSRILSQQAKAEAELVAQKAEAKNPQP